MNNELRFFSRLYLENICLDMKEEKDIYNKISKLFNDKEFIDYSTLLDKISINLEEKKNSSKLDIIMFQIDDGDKISKDKTGQNVIIINKISHLSIPILRSELIDYYNNFEGSENSVDKNIPCSKLILDIEDSVRIVEVEEEQKDLVVQQFRREKCYIAYVQIDFVDNNKKRHVYFAIIFPKDINDSWSVLQAVKKFLYFRYDLVKKIEVDFRGNSMGKTMLDYWRCRWLSIDKAGSHSDVSQNDTEIKKLNFDHNSVFFPKFFGINSDEQSKTMQDEYYTIIKLLANKQIARIFRKVISTSGKKFEPILDSVDDDKIGETVMKLPENENERVTYRNVEFIFNGKKINESKIFKTVSPSNKSKKYCGMRECVPLTYKLKYLRSILVDIIDNIFRYSDEAYINIEENVGSKSVDYLVFKNNIKDLSNNGINELVKNYDLKKQIEFDEIYNQNHKLGFSLATAVTFLNATDSNVKAYYENNYFYIKLPIISKGN